MLTEGRAIMRYVANNHVTNIAAGSTIIIAIIAVTLSPLGRMLEATMVTHVLFQLPFLATCGFLFGVPYTIKKSADVRSVNRGGITGFIIISFLLAFWMIPRWLDASLSDVGIAYFKYISMLTLGFILALSWPRAHLITRAVVKIEFLTMLFRLSWIYLISPERLCNNYLISDQIWLGRGFFVLGLTFAITWMLPVFFGTGFNASSCQHKAVS